MFLTLSRLLTATYINIFVHDVHLERTDLVEKEATITEKAWGRNKAFDGCLE